MRLVGAVRDPLPWPEQRFTTLWHGEMGGDNNYITRNVGSVTNNGVGDLTITFQTAYQGTPFICLGSAQDQEYTSLKAVPTTSSARLCTNTGSNTAVNGRKVGFAAGGQF